MWGENNNDVLAKMEVMPDFSFRSNQEKTSLDYIHRTTNTEEIYFVVNRFARKGINDFEFRYLTSLPDRYEDVECTFRVSGKVPQPWNPKTGEKREIFVWREENGQTIVPIHLEPEGFVFVVFTDDSAQKHVIAIQKDGRNWFPGNQFETNEMPLLDICLDGKRKVTAVYEPGSYLLTWSDGRKEVVKTEQSFIEKELTGIWNHHFDPKWGGPEKIEISELKSWIKFDEPGIKYYSGTANYLKSFSMTANDIRNKLLILDLGNVQEMASEKINRDQMQVMWSAPFQFDITHFVREGANDLEVEVVNLWPTT